MQNNTEKKHPKPTQDNASAQRKLIEQNNNLLNKLVFMVEDLNAQLHQSNEIKIQQLYETFDNQIIELERDMYNRTIHNRYIFIFAPVLWFIILHVVVYFMQRFS